MERRIRHFLLIAFALFSVAGLRAQDTGEMIDKIVAVVGDDIILFSDIEIQALQRTQGAKVTDEIYCGILEQSLFEKVLINQAKIDSLEISEEEVAAEVDNRLTQYIQIFGSVDAMEEYYGKSVEEWRDEFKEPVEQQLLAQRMEQQLFGNIRVTPGEVSDYFNEIPKDSLPLMNATLEYSLIKYSPEVSEEEKNRVSGLLDSLRAEMLAMTPERMSTKFKTYAARYSEDPGSKYKGGCYGMQAKGNFVPEYEAAVFNTAIGSISPVFETIYGYHIVWVRDIKGQNYESCHILMSAKAGEEDMVKAEEDIRELYQNILSDSISFADAAKDYSDDELSKAQKGRVMSQYTGSTKIDIKEMSQDVFFILDELKTGEMSEPVYMQLPGDNAPAWYIFKLDKRNDAHRANLDQDYRVFKSQTEKVKRKKMLDKWIRNKIKETYIWLDEDMMQCDFNFEWTGNMAEK